MDFTRITCLIPRFDIPNALSYILRQPYGIVSIIMITRTLYFWQNVCAPKVSEKQN